MSRPDLSGKIALITGASKGIGAAVALGLAECGAHVIATGRTIGALEELDDRIQAANNGQPATLLPLDLGRLDEVDKIGPTIAERFGRLDILIGNAGILGPLSPIGHIKPQDWEKVFKINFMANIRLVRTVEPLLRLSDGARVLFTTSAIADDTPAYWSPYASSKAALNAFVRTYAAENISNKTMRINAIHPGTVATNMLDDAFPGGAPFAVKQPIDVVDDFLSLVAPDCAKHGEIVKLK
jgi:NAD(P)-dependent dehydrogenase (short-subunit alcohol dehydrogenase family)